MRELMAEPPDTARRTVTMAFSYKLLDLGGLDHPTLEAMLNRYGTEGWQLVTVLPPQTAILSRPSQQPNRQEAPQAVVVKYRDPETGETWSGRGRMAGWLARRIEAGARLEDFLV